MPRTKAFPGALTSVPTITTLRPTPTTVARRAFSRDLDADGVSHAHPRIVHARPATDHVATAKCAHASFLVGLSYEYVGSVDSLHTYRIYAEFNNAEDVLMALYGNEAAPWSLAVDGYLHQGVPGRPLPMLGAEPTDSWFTIGEDGSNGAPALFQVGMDGAWADFENGLGFNVASPAGGAVFSLPDSLSSASRKRRPSLDSQLLTVNLQWRTPSGVVVPQPGTYLAFPQEVGCTDPEACNFDAAALVDDGSAPTSPTRI